MGNITENVVSSFKGTDKFIMSEHIDGQDYSCDFEFVLSDPSYSTDVDRAGIPIRIYDSVGPQYNPTRIAGLALACWQRFRRTGDIEHRIRFLELADWFVTSEDGSWPYNFPWLDLQPPWLSGMAQGQGISVLVRAWRETGNERYLMVARRAASLMIEDFGSQGIRSTMADGSPFLEEYPTPAAGRVLNGHLFAVEGLCELLDVDNDDDLRLFISDVLMGLNNNIYLWDLRSWSAYDLLKTSCNVRNPSTPNYHNIHIALLSWIIRYNDANNIIVDTSNINNVLISWINGKNSVYARAGNLVRKIVFRSIVKADR